MGSEGGTAIPPKVLEQMTTHSSSCEFFREVDGGDEVRSGQPPGAFTISALWTEGGGMEGDATIV